MAEDNGISIALTPVQLFAMLNGKSISPGELASNTWHEMPSPPPFAEIERFLATLPEPPSARQDAWSHQSHYSQPTPPGCWVPPPIHPPSETSLNRGSAVLSIIGGGAETVGGVLLILTPEPTMITKVGGSALALHGLDTTQAAIRQLFSGKPVADLTQTGATWAAKEVGASDKTAQRIGVVLDVAVPFAVGAGIIGAEKIAAIRAGRVILSEQAVAGKTGRISLDVEEQNKAIGKEGGHALQEHVNVNRDYLEDRAMKSQNPTGVFGRYYSKEIAEEAVNDTVRANRAAIKTWAMNTTRAGATQEFELELQRPLGEAFLNATGKYQELTKARVVFKIAKNSTKLFYIVTTYPIP